MRIEQCHFHHHKVVSVVSGFNHAAAVTKNGGIYTWGQVASTHGDAVLAQANLNVGNGDIFKRSLLDLVDRYLPVLMEPNALRNDADLIQTDTCVGRFHNLLTEHALAFAMGTHPRLGRVISTNRASRRLQGNWPDNFSTNTPCVYVAIPAELIESIIGAARHASALHSKMPEAVARMIGGLYESQN